MSKFVYEIRSIPRRVRRILGRVFQMIRDLNFYSRSKRQVFRDIYLENRWGSSESRSGVGSEIQKTTRIRIAIPNLIRDYNIERILDAPCGDFNWMKLVITKIDVNYLGADIVPELIVKNNQMFRTDKIEFSCMDIVIDPLPIADLMICRDCLFHLSFKDIFQFFENFCLSEIKYLLVTSHIHDKKNIDIKSGQYRPLSLFSSPFTFPTPLERFNDNYEKKQKELCLFTRQQLLSELKGLVKLTCSN